MFVEVVSVSAVLRTEVSVVDKPPNTEIRPLSTLIQDIFQIVIK